MKIVILSMFISVSVFAQSSNGINPNFPYEVNGKHWSKIRGEFTNGCVPEDVGNPCNAILEGPDNGTKPVRIWDDGSKLGSKAAQECARIGGRLPSLWDYIDLFRSLGPSKYFWTHPEGAMLTQAGADALSEAFGNESLVQFYDKRFWTSSAADGDSPSFSTAYVAKIDYDGNPSPYPRLDGRKNRSYALLVRCIQD